MEVTIDGYKPLLSGIHNPRSLAEKVSDDLYFCRVVYWAMNSDATLTLYSPATDPGQYCQKIRGQLVSTLGKFTKSLVGLRTKRAHFEGK